MMSGAPRGLERLECIVRRLARTLLVVIRRLLPCSLSERSLQQRLGFALTLQLFLIRI